MIKAPSILSIKSLWLLLGFLFAIYIALPALSKPLFDDAYIHARIANNLTNFGMPVFNQGANYKIDSSTGFVLLIALFSSFADVIYSIHLIVFLVISITILTVFSLPLLCQISYFKVCIFLACTLPFFLLSSYGGMETSLVCLLLILSAIFWVRNLYQYFILCLSLASCMRFEIIPLFFLSIFYLMISKRLGYKFLIWGTPTFAIFIYELIFLKSIVPHAAIAKSIAYGFPISESFQNALRFGFNEPFLIFDLLGLPDYLPNGPRFGFGFKKAFNYLLLCSPIIEFIIYLMDKKKFQFSYFYSGLSFFIFTGWALSKSSIFPWYYCLVVLSYGLSILFLYHPIIAFIASNPF